MIRKPGATRERSRPRGTKSSPYPMRAAVNEVGEVGYRTVEIRQVRCSTTRETSSQTSIAIL